MKLGVGRLWAEARDSLAELAPGLADHGRRHVLGGLLGIRSQPGLGHPVGEGIEQ